MAGRRWILIVVRLRCEREFAGTVAHQDRQPCHASGSGGHDNTFLFSNIVGMDWAVLNLDVFGRNRGNVEIEMISHVGVTSVPSLTLGLFGLSLAGLALARRKRRQ